MARLRSIQGWRASSQSSIASISLPVTAPRPRTAPRVEAAVSGVSCRAVASLESGASTRATMAASARSRSRLRSRCRMRGSPSCRQVPSTAQDMTMRQAAPHGERLVRAFEGDASLDHPADALDQPGRQVGEVGEGLPADALAFAPGLAEQDRGPAAAVRDGFDVVGHGRRPCMETRLPAL